MQFPSELLGPAGPLSTRVEGFAPRKQQQAMADAVAECIDGGETLVAEAGTGTGKTFAYLVPVLMSGKKTIISTGTKNLQDQLYLRDVPVIREALGVPVDVTILKGRANYLCLHRLELLESEGRFRSAELANKVVRIAEWKTRTNSGDIAEFVDVPENDPVWPLVTSTADNCLGQDCPVYEKCHLVHARRNAQAADVVIINHHLLLADMALREEGFGELLPFADTFIIDEAHQLPDVASSFFGISLSSNQLLELASDLQVEYLREINETNQVSRLADRLKKIALDIRAQFGAGQRRGSWKEISSNHELPGILNKTKTILLEIKKVVEPLAGRGKGMESCSRRTVSIYEKLVLLTGEISDEYIHWFETHKRSVSFHLTPLEIADAFQQSISGHHAAWVFTSATLAVGNSFEHFSRQLGLVEPRCLQWGSPFDFEKQAIIYLPGFKVEPASPGYTSSVVALAKDILKITHGRAFLLFTSHRALQEASAELRNSLSYPVLVQGDAPRDVLLDRFRELGNAVLLGTSSFWEGVDVRGSSLCCVIIDKLPFASPGDPVLQARIDSLRRNGGNPFRDYQLPSAVITLKQGAGRLIRDPQDFGVLVICDPRLVSKSYGRTFRNSLPKMGVARTLNDIEIFFQQAESEYEHELACN